LARVQNLVRANVLGLAQEVLEARGAAPQPTPRWLQWERQLWAVYRLRGRWQKLYERTRQLPPDFPREILREAHLQAVKALTSMSQGSAARRLIRQQLLDADAPPRHRWQLRQSLVTAYLNDDLLHEARVALERLHHDYGAWETDSLLLSAAVMLRSGDADAAVNLLAPLDQPAARLLRLYARLTNRTLAPGQVVERASALLETPQGRSVAREIRAVIAQAHLQAGAFYPLVDALEVYLLAPVARDLELSGVYPHFEVPDLFDAYARVARDQVNQAGLLVGEEHAWLERARQLPPATGVGRKALFAHLAATAARGSALRRDALDGYVNALIDTDRIALIARLFGPGAMLGELSLGGQAGLRLAAHALSKGDFDLAAEANANLLGFPVGLDRKAWLLQAGRIDIFAGRHRRGADKLEQWVQSFSRFDAAQTDAILQPIFDLQMVGRHRLALALLHKVNERAPPGKHQREITYWLAESYAGSGQYHQAADLFLHSALQAPDSFDPWGRAARFRAAEALMDGGLFEDARRLFQDLLAGAASDASRNSLRQKLQRIRLLESGYEPPNDRE
ncbi:MAG: hypothetical protein OXU22_00235, partial [Gammaproteobacteria bacterium]|nr:hypothetical protein [Gammaproteobacteria bacterium]